MTFNENSKVAKIVGNIMLGYIVAVFVIAIGWGLFSLVFHNDFSVVAGAGARAYDSGY